MKRLDVLAISACAALLLPALLVTVQAAPSPKATVAILDFSEAGPGVKKQAANAPDKLATALAKNNMVKTVVDRALVKDAVAKAGAGPDETRADRVAAVVGADVVVEGQVARIDKTLWVTCKVTDLRVKSVIAQVVKGPEEDRLEDIMQKMADKIGNGLAAGGADAQGPGAPPQ
jgi:hypothetical protein